MHIIDILKGNWRKKSKHLKKKRKPWTKRDTFYAILTLVVTFMILVFLSKTLKNYKEKQLADSFITIGVIEKLKERASKRKGVEDRIFFYFVKNDTVFHRTYFTRPGKIDKHKIKVGDCFKLKVAKRDYAVFEPYFDNRIDTVIDKKQYKNHIYNTIFHRMKFE
ncbi:hypothetical protein [uncultured Kordia sp.]|uniref:hypothetical protein n=1 Tax=uncultured Kordia sp. TaxID=507699 RepID=UPI002610ADA7|nr:hypothetical protein [uncultured Kordia sp.]